MISIDLTTHPELYDDYRKGVEYCSNIPDVKATKETIFHVQWTGSDIGRMQIMPIKAFCTSQDMEFSRLIVWVDREYSGEQFQNVEFMIYNPFKEIQGTPFEGRRLHWQSTDIMRMVYLSKYGGVHIDMDTVLLRDLAPLLDQEFFYTWGIRSDEIAGGVINLFKGSAVNNAICGAIIEGGHGLYKELFTYVRERLCAPQNPHPFAVWPCAWFNTEWAIHPDHYIDNDHFQFIRSPVIASKYASEFYDGVFSWHWHNCWTSEIEKGSKWELMERFINKKYKEKYG